MRIMAIDYGEVRTGIAVSDALGILCGEAWTLSLSGINRVATAIAEEAKKRNVSRLVLGLPRNMDGSEGHRAGESRRLKEKIEALCDIPVFLWDERRTTVDAHRILHESGKKQIKHKKLVDAVAASLILEGYLGTV